MHLRSSAFTKQFLLSTAVAVFVTAVPIAGPLMARSALAQDNATSQDEIIVSARKRDETLLEVPMSITALDGLAIETQGIENVTDLRGRVPGISFSTANIVAPTTDNVSIVMRGVGFNPIAEPSVGVFIDGVYQTGVGFDVGFLDLERVEVLRGPQGTLFGRNTQGGAINIVTRKPGKEFTARAMIEGDDLASMRALASVSGPISENFFGSIAAQASHTDGYFNNTTTGRDQDDVNAYGGRVALRWAPTDNIDVNLTVDGSARKGSAVGVGVPFAAGESYDVGDNDNPDYKRSDYGASLQINIDLGGTSLTSITGARGVENEMGADIDGSPAGLGFQEIDITQSNISQELRLASDNDSPFSWLAGTYLFKEVQEQAVYAEVYGGFIIADSGSKLDRKGLALFGQASYDVTDRLELTAGVRWSTEKVDGKHASLLIFAGTPLPVIAHADTESFADISPMASIAYDITDDVMVYATAAKGYKSGSFEKFPTSGSPFLPFDSETSWNFEGGSKGKLMDGRLTYSGSFFWVKINDMQLVGSTIDPLTQLPALQIVSVGKSHTYGFELESSLQVTDNLTLSGSTGYTKTEFDEFTDENGLDRSGEAFPYVPKWTAAARADYRGPFNSSLDFLASASYRYVGPSVVGMGTNAAEERFNLSSYGIVDFEVGVAAKRWELVFFVRNAFDEYAITNKFPDSLSPAAGDGWNTVLAPRVFGARASVNW